jgi:hypothetical protein
LSIPELIVRVIAVAALAVALILAALYVTQRSLIYFLIDQPRTAPLQRPKSSSSPPRMASTCRVGSCQPAVDATNLAPTRRLVRPS